MDSSLPMKLRGAIFQAHIAMEQHPEHVLPPIYRRAIYEALRESTSGQLPPKLLLDLLTTKWVLPIWLKEAPNHPWPQHLLDKVEGVQKGRVTRDMAFDAAQLADLELDRLDSTDNKSSNSLPPRISVSAASVCYAALGVLFEAAGCYRFEEEEVTAQTIDSDLDTTSADVAMWAMRSYAGAPWDRHSDPDKRQKFWEWWLLTAIPHAWMIGKSG